jgi:metal-sulfur cluster biosynthetic enzyme
MNEQEVKCALRGVIDPELGIDVVNLGLVYGIEVDGNALAVAMTMTSPSCPLGEYMTESAERILLLNFPHTQVAVALVWDPPWHPGMITDEGRRALDGADRPRTAA